MDAGKYSSCAFDDSRIGIFLRRNGSHQERPEHDDDVDGDNRNRQHSLGYLWFRISLWI